jgi:hypothetical protein
MRFTNGNVGIGTTAPAYKLHIDGNVNATSLLKAGSVLSSGTSTFNSILTYSTTATLTATSPTDVEVSGQIGDVTIALPENNTSGNIITVHNVGGTMGSSSSSVFVRMGTSSTSGSIARIKPGESVTTIALQTAGTTPKAYQKAITRKYGNGTGLQWTERTIPNTRNWSSVTWAPELGLFCAVNNNSAAVVMTSPDGITWTERSIPNNRSYLDICWASELGLFCAVNSSNGYTLTSSNGITWTEQQNFPATDLLSWAPELSIFCSIPTSNTTTFKTSPNGNTWTTRTVSATTRQYNSICWAPELGLFCAVSYTSAFVVTSPDGITWTDRSIPNNRSWYSVCWSPELGLFCAVNNNSAAFVMTSPDGITWSERAIPNKRAWLSVIWAPEVRLFCAVNYANAAFVMTSPDGITWTERSIPNTSNWIDITWAPELMTFCAVNQNSVAVVLNSFGIPFNLQKAPVSTSMGNTTIGNSTVTYTLSNYFTDTIGTGLTYSLTANPQSNASILNGILSVTGNYRNTSYTVTVTATNGIGKTSTSSLSVTEVQLTAPTSSSMGSTSSLTTNTVQYTLSSYFTGPDLIYTLTANPQSSASISNGVLSVTGNYRDTSYTVTVEATNSGGSASSSLIVNEAVAPNPSSTSMGSTSSLTNNTVQYTLSNYFTDSTGTGLTYTLTANPQSSASISNGVLSVTGNYRSTSYTVTVQATNGYSKSTTSSLTVNEATPSAPISSSMGSTSSLTNNTVQYTLSNYFTGINMTYTLTANPQSSANISNGVLSVTGNYRDTSYTVTVEATNLGGSATSSLTVNETYMTFATTLNSISSTNRNWKSVAWSDSLTRFTIATNSMYAVSSNGSTWTEGSLGNLSAFTDMTWSPELSMFCLISASSTSSYLKSTDGTNWSLGALPAAYALGCIAWSPDLTRFCAAGNGTNDVLISSNGTSWTRYAGITGIWRGMVWSSSLNIFCAVGINTSDVGVVMTSSDGTSWTSRTIANQNWIDVAGRNPICAVSTDNYIAYSGNGTSWSLTALPSGAIPQNIAYSENLKAFCVVRIDGTICVCQEQYVSTPAYWRNYGSSWSSFGNFTGRIKYGNVAGGMFISVADTSSYALQIYKNN